MSNKGKTTITFQMPTERADELKAYALEHADDNISMVLRRIIREFLGSTAK